MYDSKIESQMSFFLDIAGLHSCIRSDEKVFNGFFVRVFQVKQR